MKTTSAELKIRAKRTLSGRYGLCIGAQLIQYFLMFAFLAALMGVAIWRILSVIDRDTYGRLDAYPGLSGGMFPSIAPSLAPVLATIIFMALAEVVVMALFFVIGMGIKKIYLNLSLGEPAGIGDIFYAFSHRMHRFIGLYFINVLVGFVLNIPSMILSFVSAVAANPMFIMGLMQLFNIFQMVGSVMFALYFAQAGLIMLENPEMKVIASMKESARLMKGNKGDLFYLYMSFIGVACLGLLSFGIALLWIYPYIECTNVHFYLQLKESDLQARYEAYGYAGGAVNDGRQDFTDQNFTGQNWQ